MRRSTTTMLALCVALAGLVGPAAPAAADLATTPPGSKTFMIKPSEESATLCPVGLQLKSVQAMAEPTDAVVPIVLLARDRKDLPDGRIVIPYGFRFLRKVEAPVRVVMICGY